MTKTAKRSLLIVASALLVAAAAFVIVHLTAPSKDLRAALAAALHLPKDREQKGTRFGEGCPRRYRTYFHSQTAHTVREPAEDAGR